MPWVVISLVAVGCALACPLTAALVRIGERLNLLDSAGVAGQNKVRRAVPNTGGVAIFWAIVLPMLAGLIAAHVVPAETVARVLPGVEEHLAGVREQTPLAALLIACMAVLHVMGLVDDRRPMGPWLKLGVMVGVAAAVPILSQTRLLTMLDAHVGGPWLSIIVTTAWIVVVTNAMNFMDNMDGLSGGVAAVAGSCFLAATLVNGQWFVAACLALLVGACLGFLVFNFPRRAVGGDPRAGKARIFMGDGGSLVLGFLLAFLTTRTTYYVSPEVLAARGAAGIGPTAWYGVFMPLTVLAVPLYDFVTVVLLRLRQGKSPLVGDRQHFSHRLVERGLSERDAVLVICGCAGVTGIAGIVLSRVAEWQAALIGLQTLVVLGLVALWERATPRAGERR